jgi:hypothetical protein
MKPSLEDHRTYRIRPFSEMWPADYPRPVAPVIDRSAAIEEDRRLTREAMEPLAATPMPHTPAPAEPAVPPGAMWRSKKVPSLFARWSDWGAEFWDTEKSPRWKPSIFAVSRHEFDQRMHNREAWEPVAAPAEEKPAEKPPLKVGDRIRRLTALTVVRGFPAGSVHTVTSVSEDGEIGVVGDPCHTHLSREGLAWERVTEPAEKPALKVGDRLKHLDLSEVQTVERIDERGRLWLSCGLWTIADLEGKTWERA